MNAKSKDFLNARWFKPVKENSGILISLIMISVVLSFATPYFLKPANIINVILQISINAVVAYGMTFVILIGGIDLSVGAVMGMVGIITTTLMSKLGLPINISMLCGLLVGLIVGLTNGVITVKVGIPSFIVTLATTNIAKGVSLVVSAGKPIYVDDPMFSEIGNGQIGFVPLQIVYMLTVFVILLVLLNYSRFGKHVYATGGNKEAARFSGINIQFVQIAAFVICGVTAALGGLMSSARLYSGQPKMGEGGELDAIAAVVLGGTMMTGGAGRLGGTLIGALIIGIINNGLNLLGINAYWQYIAKGVIILIAVAADVIKKYRKG